MVHEKTKMLAARRELAFRLRDQLVRALPVLVLAACAPTPSPPAPAPPPSAAPPPATASAPSAAVAPPSPFSLFAEGWEVAIADTHGPVVIHDQLLGAMVTVEAERITRVDMPFHGLPAAAGTRGSITGKWPEGAILTIRAEVLDPMWGIRGVVGFFRRTGGSWVTLSGIGQSILEGTQLNGPDDANFDAHVAAASDGQSFVFPYPYDSKGRLFSGTDHRLRAVGSTSLRRIYQIGTLPNGEIVVLGRDDEERWLVQRLRPGRPGATTTPVTIPQRAGADLLSARMCPAADDAIHIAGWSETGFAFLTSQGSSWTTSRNDIPVKGRAPLAGCAIGRDGSAWLVFRSRRSDSRRPDPDATAELYRRSPAGVIERVPYPTLPPLERRLRFEDDPTKKGQFRMKLEDVPPSAQLPGSFRGEDVFVADDGSVWISGLRGETDDPSVEHDGNAPFELTWRVVLRLGPPLAGTPIDWGSLAPHVVASRLAAYNAETKGYNKLFPAEPTCSTFVRLGPLPKTPPASEDFSAVRAVVKDRGDLTGTRFIEARVEGVHVLGALAPDDETGKRLFSLFKGRIPGAKLYCGRPRVLRVIPMGIPEEK